MCRGLRLVYIELRTGPLPSFSTDKCKHSVEKQESPWELQSSHIPSVNVEWGLEEKQAAHSTAIPTISHTDDES